MINKKEMALAVFILIIFVLIGSFIIYRDYNAKGNISKVERIIKDENGHRKEDIEKTFDMIEDKFNAKDYKDCILNKITYFGNFMVDGKYLEESYKDSYNADEVITLVIDFTTGKHPSVSFVKDNEYTYKAVFVKKENSWMLKEYGQG